MEDLKSIFEKAAKKLKQLGFKEISLLSQISGERSIDSFLKLMHFIWLEADLDFKSKIETTHKGLYALPDAKFMQIIFITMVPRLKL